LAGEPRLLDGGRIRLPLTIRCGEGEKKVFLTLAVTQGDE
jgi:hypothetical protein